VAVTEKELKESLEKREYWWWAEKARSPRIDYLRKAVWFKGAKGSSYLPGVKVDLHMLKTYTEIFQGMEAATDPFFITRAKAYAETLDTVPIFIIDQSRIVGYTPAGSPNLVLWNPISSYYINDDIFNDRGGLIDDSDRPWP